MEQPHQHAKFSVNVIFHVLVLFTALSVLFFFVVAGQERESLQGTFTDLLRQNMPSMLSGANEESGGALKALLNENDAVLAKLEASLTKEDPAVATQNKWLAVTAVLIGGIILAMLLSSTITMRLECKRDVSSMMLSVWPPGIVWENLLIFSVIGCAEYAFFKLVASKYVPVAPSTVVKQIVTTIQRQP